MMHSEFNNLAKIEVSDEDFIKIESVYMWYPGVESKDQIVALYKIGGMLLINDMLPRAEKILAINHKMQNLKGELNTLTNFNC